MGLRSKLITVAALAMLLTPSPALAQTAMPAPPASPPGHPATGPDGQAAMYDSVVAKHYGPTPDGTVDTTGFWLFEPSEPRAGAPTGPVPLVLFFHGYFGADPAHYRAWIDHIVQRGAV